MNTKPNLDTADIDIVACGSTLGNLLRFVRGIDKAFRFTFETVGNTVFFIRKENDPKEIIPDVRGFGHAFPEAYTHWEREVTSSETHQRVVNYELEGVKCLVRFECDGYFQNIKPGGRSKYEAGQDNREYKSSNHNDEALLAALNKSTITQPFISPSSSSECVTVKHGGSEVPQASIFDLKTRSGKYKKEIDMSDIYPQLWIKQVPNFIIAYHDGAGLFEDIKVQDVRKGVQKWETENFIAVRRLAVLLKTIIEFAREKGGLLEVYSPSADCLEIRKQYGEGKPALPSGLKDEWVGKSGADMYLSGSDDNERGVGGGYDSDDRSDPESDEDEPDYTACSAEDCGYCGKCTY
jgi:hypothetical protein